MESLILFNNANAKNITFLSRPFNTKNIFFNSMALLFYSLIFHFYPSTTFSRIESHWVFPSFLGSFFIKANEKYFVWHGTDFRLIRPFLPIFKYFMVSGTHICNSYWMGLSLSKFFPRVQIRRPAALLNPNLQVLSSCPLKPPKMLPIRLLVVARLTKQKCVHRVLKAVQHLDKSLYSLSIVGDGPESQMLQKYVKINSLTDNVFFLGQADPIDMPHIYQNHDCLLLLSKAEGLALVVTEALSYGLYAFIADDSGLRDHLQHPLVQIASENDFFLAQQIKTLANYQHESFLYWRDFLS